MTVETWSEFVWCFPLGTAKDGEGVGKADGEVERKAVFLDGALHEGFEEALISALFCPFNGLVRKPVIPLQPLSQRLMHTTRKLFNKGRAK